MKIIDAHIHLTRDGSWFDTEHDASVERALREMDSAGIEKAAVIPMPGQEQREFTLELIDKQPDRFFTGFTITTLDDGELAALEDCLASGIARFVKVHPRTTGIRPLDPGLDPFLACAEKHDTPVVFCTYMRGPRLPMADLAPLVYDELARKWPNLKIVLAHAGSYRAMEALAVGQSHANVYLEFSHVIEYFQGSSLDRDFAYMMEKLDRKILYGSDFPEYAMDVYLEKAKKIAGQRQNMETSGFFGGLASNLYKL